jgi:hypothetical protein
MKDAVALLRLIQRHKKMGWLGEEDVVVKNDIKMTFWE